MIGLIVCGSSEFYDYDTLTEKIDWFLKRHTDKIIYAERSHGASILSLLYAREKNIHDELFEDGTDEEIIFEKCIQNSDTQGLVVFGADEEKCKKYIKIAQDKNIKYKIV